MTSESTRRRRVCEELDSFMHNFELNELNESSGMESPNEMLHADVAVLENNANIFRSNNSFQSLIFDEDNLNCAFGINSASPQKCVSSVFPTKCINLCTEVKSKLAKWVVSFNISHNALNGLLLILKHIPGLTDISIDTCTVLNTHTMQDRVQEAEQLIPVKPGLYHHFGLGLAIKKHFNIVPNINIDVIQVVIGIDGLPLSKSSSSQFWLIFGYIRPFKDSVFPIGVYWSHKKPLDSNQFLKEFVNET